ncbi:MAG: NAD-dependent epimerase/dehydratase family protein [Stellaceae bacterium]
MTGAAGFIGRALCRELVQRSHEVRGVTRGKVEPIAGVVLRPIGDIGPDTDWTAHLEGIEIIVHLATSAHRPVNEATGIAEAKAAASLVRAADAAGVHRFVHISSIRAMGEETPPGRRFTATDLPSPQDAYGRAKLAIEHAIIAAAGATGVDLVILRPPLVYGPGVKGNLRALIKLITTGVPLPFAELDSRRSMIFIGNLVDLLVLACTHPAAASRLLLARDAEDLSIPELVRALAGGLGRRVRLFPAPAALFTGLSLLPVLRPALRRLTLPLLVDDAETRRALGWMPVVSSGTGLASTARAYARRS